MTHLNPPYNCSDGSYTATVSLDDATVVLPAYTEPSGWVVPAGLFHKPSISFSLRSGVKYHISQENFKEILTKVKIDMVVLTVRGMCLLQLERDHDELIDGNPFEPCIWLQRNTVLDSPDLDTE